MNQLQLNREESLVAARQFKAESTVTLYDYHIYHYYDYVPSTYHVRTAFPPNVMEVWIAYIQFLCSDIDMDFELDYDELGSVLTSFYEGQIIKESEAAQRKVLSIDLYYTWEKWCGLADEVQQVQNFQRENLLPFLKEMVKKSIALKGC